MNKMMMVFALVGVVLCIPILSACEPAIKHSIEGRADCISCHGVSGVKPYPAFHAERQYGNSDCIKCHKPANNARA